MRRDDSPIRKSSPRGRTRMHDNSRRSLRYIANTIPENAEQKFLCAEINLSPSSVTTMYKIYDIIAQWNISLIFNCPRAVFSLAFFFNYLVSDFMTKNYGSLREKHEKKILAIIIKF